MTKRHILVADDDAAIRGMLRNFLEGEGYTISEAQTGGEVVKVQSRYTSGGDFAKIEEATDR